MGRPRLSVAFLWHMHQPLYKDLVTGKYHLPWVRLHSTYSYLDMASILDDFPGVKCTFNLTPSLIWQLLDISGGGGEDDTYYRLSGKNASDLTSEDRYFILRNFFSFDLNKATFSLRRYKELFFKRGNDLQEEVLREKVKEFGDSDLRDIQVLFNLAWCGFTLKEKDPLIRGLLRKGEFYTEDEKAALLKRQDEVVASIIPLYKRLQDEGRIEISTSPYYHPITPLLCGGDPGEGFDFADDARAQVKKAVDLYKKVFGKAPAGIWPPEGGVSQEIIPVMVEEGIKWIASDEGVLLESFRGEDIPREELLYRAFTAEEKGSRIDMLFRDVNISNAISFEYAGMPGKKAAANLIRDIGEIAGTVGKHDSEHVVSIILDGENPWPYFADGGKSFLSKIYKKLSSGKETDLVTVGGYLGSRVQRKRIKRLFSGSWMEHSFRKWTGSPQKDKAWEYLEKARKELFASGHPDSKALEELYIAEGSDWFWWYDDFESELNFVFDELFRMHLANIYTLSGEKPPYYLSEPVPSGPLVRDLRVSTPPSEMARVPKVLFVSSEAVPYAKTGGLADVSGSLPKALASFGCDIRGIMPLYGCVKDGNFKLTKEAVGIKPPFSGGIFGFDLYSNREKGVSTFFIKNKKYFERPWLYGTPKGDYPDNGQRFGYFSRAALASIKKVGFKPDIIHCNDWQTALIPFYLRFQLNNDEFFSGIKTLFTIHNIAYQGVFNRRIMRGIGIPDSFFNMNDLEFYGRLNFMKSGILYSDAVSTVSRRYAEEIMTPKYGCGLDGLLRSRKDTLYGIPNGADYSVWSPGSDSHIKVNYDAGDLDGKKKCKRDLLEHTGLPLPPEAPLLGCVTRLAEQKGMDLLARITGRIVELGAGLVILGRGSSRYNRLFSGLAGKYPGNVYVCNDFNDELAHKIEAGCDIFLMPSRYEPCGLNQIYSIKYGTIPVVRATGGLDDVIVDFDEDRDGSNGFKFGPITEDALFAAVRRALNVYEDKDSWKALMVRAMKYDFSWARSAEKYMELYRNLMSR
ncbi:MAG: glycogen synthase GlgA [Candidatus Omnitrophota bacterium]|nr:glycogen synthase GlgA [Candidatus Omnitrophota bacterium]